MILILVTCIPMIIFLVHSTEDDAMSITQVWRNTQLGKYSLMDVTRTHNYIIMWLDLAKLEGTCEWVIGCPSVGLGVNMRWTAWSMVGRCCNMLHHLRLMIN